MLDRDLRRGTGHKSSMMVEIIQRGRLLIDLVCARRIRLRLLRLRQDKFNYLNRPST